jgi:hypothetical protein
VKVANSFKKWVRRVKIGANSFRNFEDESVANSFKKWVRDETKRVRIASKAERETGGNSFKFQCAKIGQEYAKQITYMQANMQLIRLGIASDFKGCRLDIPKTLGCMLDICRKI